MQPVTDEQQKAWDLGLTEGKAISRARIEALDARVKELEDTIVLDRCEAAIASSFGRNTYACTVAEEIRARRGEEWNGAVVKDIERI